MSGRTGVGEWLIDIVRMLIACVLAMTVLMLITLQPFNVWLIVGSLAMMLYLAAPVFIFKTIFLTERWPYLNRHYVWVAVYSLLPALIYGGMNTKRRGLAILTCEAAALTVTASYVLIWRLSERLAPGHPPV